MEFVRSTGADVIIILLTYRILNNNNLNSHFNHSFCFTSFTRSEFTDTLQF